LLREEVDAMTDRIVRVGVSVRALAGLAAALVIGTGAPVPDESLFYTRADVIAGAIGEASLRRAYTRQLGLPAEKCEGGGDFTCVEHRVYGQVYSIEFVQEVMTGGAIERRDKGRFSIALSFPKDVEDRFEADLVARLAHLDAAAFDAPRARLGYLDEPLAQGTLEKSALPVWVCAEGDGDHNYDLLISDARGTRSYSGWGEAGSAACRDIARAAAGVEPSRFRTAPDIQTQRRAEVRLSSASTLSGLTWASRLAPIPEGVTFEKKALPRQSPSGGLRDLRAGVFVGKEGRYGDVQRDVTIPRASLDLAAAPMWVARWRFDVIRERFGEIPKSERGPTQSLVVAVVPLSDPSMLERSKLDLSVPDDQFLAAAAKSFRSGGVTSADVVGALNDPRVWPARGEWLVVTCRDDGTARYGIAPFADVADVANAREACAAIRGVIGD
jgi:hypothetical protein